MKSQNQFDPLNCNKLETLGISIIKIQQNFLPDKYSLSPFQQALKHMLLSEMKSKLLLFLGSPINQQCLDLLLMNEKNPLLLNDPIESVTNNY